MGQDKALLQLLHKPAWQWVVEQLDAVASDVWLVRRPDQQPLAYERILFDLHPGEGPLAGMEIGLSRIDSQIAFVTGVDTPLLRTAFVQLLYRELETESAYMAVIPEYQGRLYPLLGMYKQSVQPIIAQLLEAGKRRVLDLIENVPVKICKPEQWQVYDPLAQSFLMMNTQEQVKVIVHLMKEGGASCEA
ncbi:hypothetical protein BM613_12585 [Sulfoacidibacillus thermotolerans]|uniref:MobA-like NTP transferase domain-containing protein n=2 Tax=Sulfoacidibacillus thermotolerans TaxID=1765684 RepID=A0A2U3D5W4_SULT2|nr:hypothetical protein BM613_12585 [Sulfoacidibacillus thermotolerans]